ncbi:MAG: hypothetical protein GF381_03280 [Candidatus Pacebacteria bacterium]|nr:hypothetical protein [Candidatus Paceibacterota bacterium]
MSRNKKLPWSKLMFLGLFLISLTGLVLWLINTQLLVVENLECYLDGQLEPVVCQQLSELKGQSFLFTNLDRSVLYTKLLKNDQGQIFQVSTYSKKLPSSLIIELTKQQPVYQLISQDGQSYWVNRQNYFGQNDPSLKLPQVQLKSSMPEVIQDQQVEPEFNQQLIKLVDLLSEVDLNYQQLILDGSASKLILVDGLPLLFEFGQDELRLVGQIQATVKQRELIEQELAASLKEIDFRFDLPVVRTTSSQLILDKDVQDKVDRMTEGDVEAEIDVEVETNQSASQEAQEQVSIDTGKTDVNQATQSGFPD